MSTSSITEPLIIEGKENIERFFKGLEEAERIAEEKANSPREIVNYRQATNEDIRTIIGQYFEKFIGKGNV